MEKHKKLGKEQYSEINKPLLSLWNEKQILITAHRGVSGGIIMENTVEGAKTAYKSGADLVEFDVVKSKSGTFWIFHDGYEKLWLNQENNLSELTDKEIESLYFDLHEDNVRIKRIDRLEDFLNKLPKCFLTCDRSARYWDQNLFQVIDKYTDPSYLTFKSEVTSKYLRILSDHPVKYPYMPVISNTDEINAVLSEERINCVGFEVLVKEPDELFAQPDFHRLMSKQDLLILVNCQSMEDGRQLFCGWDDYQSILVGPDAGWDRCLDIGASVIHTDFPWLVAERIKKYKTRNQ